jgi:outer membrane protein TolC
LNQLDADRARLVQLQTAETKARRAFDASRMAYDQGLVDLTTLLDAERSWRGARSALTGLQASALIDAVTTVKALGGGWSGTPPKAKG